MKAQYKQQRNKGLTLIEIMIALVISSILMLGVMGLFIGNKRIYREQNAMGRLQENARFAMDMMVRDIRKAGYAGCADDIAGVNNTLVNGGTETNLVNFKNIIEGSENGATNWLPSASNERTGSMLAGSDAITLRYFEPISNITVSGTMANGNTGTAIPVTCTPDCASNATVTENLAISDCGVADIFSVTAVNTNSLEHTGGALSKGYDTTAQVSRYVTTRYYIANGANDKSGNPIPTLFRYAFDQDKEDWDTDTNKLEYIAQPQALIEGIENLQILYGVDNNNDAIANSYVNASGVAAAGGWDNVVSVRLAILARTVNPDASAEPDTNGYNLLGTDVYTTGAPPNDKYRRRIFSSTVQIRNRSQ